MLVISEANARQPPLAVAEYFELKHLPRKGDIIIRVFNAVLFLSNLNVKIKQNKSKKQYRLRCLL